MKKKILYAITKGTWGGAQKYVFDLAFQTKERGYDVSVLFGEPGLLKDKLDQADIRTIVLPNLQRDISLTKEIRSFINLLKILRQEKPDVLHLNSSKMGALGALSGRLAGVSTIVFTIHGWAFNEERSSVSKYLLKIIYFIALLLSHRSIAVSQGIKDRVKNWPLVGKKIAVIYNYVQPIDFLGRDEARAKIASHTPNKKITASSETKWLGCIAELHTTKGLTYAIEAVSELIQEKKDVLFIIISEGEKRKELEALIKERGLAEKVFLPGYIQNAAALLKAFDIFILASISEAFGYVLLEAGLAGLPIVATRVGGIPEIITDEETGLLVSPRDSQALAEKISVLLSDPEKRILLGNALKEKIARDFPFEKLLSKTLGIYD
jgi:glycosyltransferase involved in cell wall biosynthesis